MDSLTQAALGAVIADIGLEKKYGKKALLFGAAFGTLPDLDIVQNVFLDVVAQMDYHRSYSHSIVFALVVAPLLTWLFKQNKRWGWTVFSILITHSLLDCFTTWGTKLFWPFSNTAIALKSIFIIDPLYTLCLLIPILWRLLGKNASSWMQWGLILSSCYLCFGFAGKTIAQHRFTAYHHTQHQNVIRSDTKATAFNTLLWANVAETPTHFLFTYTSLLSSNISATYSIEKEQDWPKDMENHPKVKALIRITDGYYTLIKKNNTVIMHDWRFGQGNGWHKGQGPSVFNYHITPTQTTLNIKQVPYRDRKMGDFLRPFKYFILGNYTVPDAQKFTQKK